MSIGHLHEEKVVKQTLIILAAGALCMLGCNESLPTEPASPIEITVVSGAATWSDQAVDQLTYQAPATITAMATDDGVALVGTEDGVYSVGAAGLVEVAVFAADASAPLSTGAVHAMAARQSGAFVAAEQGLFHTFEDRLLTSPLSDALATTRVHALAVDAGAATETLWLATDQGLYMSSGDVLSHIAFVSEPGAATAVGVAGAEVLVAFGPALYELDSVTLTYVAVPQQLGNITSICATGDGFSITSDAGLTVRTSDGAYQRYTLADDSTAAAEAAVAGVVLTAAGAITIDNGVLTGLAPLESTTDTGAMTIDGYGTVWIGRGTDVVGLLIGTPVSFATEVAPILELRCGICHSDGYSAPKHEFTDYETTRSLADSILARVTTAQMPPTPMPALTTDELDVLVSWYSTGQNP